MHAYILRERKYMYNMIFRFVKCSCAIAKYWCIVKITGNVKYRTVIIGTLVIKYTPEM